MAFLSCGNGTSGGTLDIPYTLGNAGQSDQITLTFDISRFSYVKVTDNTNPIFQINGVAKSLNTNISLAEYSDSIQIFLKTGFGTINSGTISFF